MSGTLTPALKKIAGGHSLTAEELESCFDLLLSGDVPVDQIGAFLMGLAVKGETSDELLAGAKAMRKHARKISLQGDILDTCGTGGLPWTSLNTSTASAIVLAACGVKVAKHGNRSVPPKTGSADVLEALGVGIDITDEQFKQSVDRAGIGFLFARSHHSAMRHVAPVRASLGIRTIFNLLGPLSNPADATHQILGVYDPHWLKPMAETLQHLGVKRAWVVHGEAVEGRAIDELSIAGPTRTIEVTPDKLTEMVITPEDAGLQRSSLYKLSGGTPEQNSKAILDVFEGSSSAFTDAIVLNAAAGLFVTGQISSLRNGVIRAQDAIESGKARETLSKLAKATTV
ncbi:MAG: anthranilate phosphoribosyltransferase [Ponticaulis sp.]|nr:anthranilate phosphoribosyltransferase [Ponticaulis sp.]|tara:strand:+ start:37540 stop:38568 length:1029 start_codon:yes stop_codon:yes gene_type:complete